MSAPHDTDLFSGYAPLAGHFDELFAAQGGPPPHWQGLTSALATMGVAAFRRRWDRAARQLKEIGLAYTGHSDPRRPWELDALPMVLDTSTWQPIARGVAQRAALMDAMLRDLYGPQLLLQQGLLPAEIVFAHPGYLPTCAEPHRPEHPLLTLYAADLARDSQGGWTVVADRTESPSGLGYALENRLVISRMLPDVFHELKVARLAPFFIALRESMRRLSLHPENPHVVLLSEGTASRHCLEDAFLARYLGYTLAEPGDLAVRSGRVALKTLGGLQPVDAIFRRIDSSGCDPLELAGDADRGVPGFVQSVRSGRVAVANALGTGLVEAPALLPYLPRIAARLLGEELQLPSLETWWCGDPRSRDFVLSNLDELVVKPAFRLRHRDASAVDDLSCLPPGELAAKIEADPLAYVGQRLPGGSQVPRWADGKLDAASLVLRSYAVAAGGHYRVMDGALSRLTAAEMPLERSIRAGEGSKDTWWLLPEPVAPVSLLPASGEPVELTRGGAELPSRVAEHLYWLGRLCERAEGATRLIRAIVQRLAGEESASARRELVPLLRLLAELGFIEPGFVVEGIRERLPSIDKGLPAAVFDREDSESLRGTLTRLVEVAVVVRDRLSPDHWRILRRIDRDFSGTDVTDLGGLLPALDTLLLNLTAASGFATEGMTRSQAWRFLDVGCRLERALQTAQLLQATLASARDEPRPLWEAVLEVTNSLMTHRSRYREQLQLVSLLDLLIADESNPRSIVYQLHQLNAHVDALPSELATPTRRQEQQLALALLHRLQMADVHDLATATLRGNLVPLRELLSVLLDGLPQLSDAIVHRYLVHAGPPRRLEEVGTQLRFPESG